jgi:broad specificity phosphatase PhoE
MIIVNIDHSKTPWKDFHFSSSQFQQFLFQVAQLIMAMIAILLFYAGVCISLCLCTFPFNYRHVELGLFPSLNASYIAGDQTNFYIPINNNGLNPGVTWAEANGNFSALLRQTDGSNYKLIMFIRHCEGWHNVAESVLGSDIWNSVESKKAEYLDARLSDNGLIQGQQLESRVTNDVKNNGLSVELIVSSPFSRALQTAQLGLTSLWSKQTIPKLSIEDARETIGVHYCDKRHSQAYLNLTFPAVDFTGLISNQDSLWRPDERESDEAEFERGRRLLDWLFARAEKRIVVVAHAGIIGMTTTSLFHQWNPAEEGQILWGDEAPVIGGYSMRNAEILPVIIRQERPHASTKAQ